MYFTYGLTVSLKRACMGKVLCEENFSLLIKESIKLYNNNGTEYTKYNWDGSVAAGAALVSHYCLSNIEYPNKRCTYIPT